MPDKFPPVYFLCSCHVSVQLARQDFGSMAEPLRVDKDKKEKEEKKGKGKMKGAMEEKIIRVDNIRPRI